MQKFIRRTQDGNIVELFYETVLNEFDTEKLGTKTYDRVLMSKFTPPGGGNQEAVHEIKRTFGNKERLIRVNKLILDKISHFVDEFEKSSDSFSIDGTPIEDVSFIHPSMVGMLKLKNIHTVEILSDVPDSALSNLGMGARDLRDKAKYYVESQKSAAPTLALAKENQELKARLDALEKMVSVPVENTDEEPKRRGRPPKDESVVAA